MWYQAITAEQEAVVRDRLLATLRERCPEQCSVARERDMPHRIAVSVAGARFGLDYAPTILIDIFRGRERSYGRENAPRIELHDYGVPSPNAHPRRWSRVYLIRPDLTYNPKLVDQIVARTEQAVELCDAAQARSQARERAARDCGRAMREAGWNLIDGERLAWGRSRYATAVRITPLREGQIVAVRSLDDHRDSIYCLPEDAPRAARAICVYQAVATALRARIGSGRQ